MPLPLANSERMYQIKAETTWHKWHNRDTWNTLQKNSVSFHHDKTLVFTSGRVLQRRCVYVCWWTNVSTCKIYREQNVEHLLRLKMLYLKKKHIPH